MKKIGSEFWDVPIKEEENSLFPECAQWFLSGRSALQAIIKELKNCHTVELPSWCCASMVKPFIDAQFEIHFYPVYWDEHLIQDISLNSDVLFLMDYFGYSTPRRKLTDYRGVVIRDITHSFLSTTYADADYCFGSLRKWCGFWTGGYAWKRDGSSLNTGQTNDFTYILLRKRAMELKRDYINNGGISDKDYLKVFDEAEEALEYVDIAPAAERDIQLAQRLNGEFIKTRRRINAEVLRKAFPNWLIFPELTDSDCPMFVPILVPDGKRDRLRHYLINNEIYCPIHWPVSEYHRLDDKTDVIYKCELSLICDQRYTEKDMNRIVETIKMFWKEV